MKHISKLIILLAFVVSSNAWAYNSPEYYKYVDVETFLMKAAKQGNLMVVNWLINNGADINKYSNTYKPALNYAVCSNNIEVVKALLAAGAQYNRSNTNALMAAAQCGNVESIKVLLAAGASVNDHAWSNDRRTALHYAAWYNHAEAIQVLLEAGADTNLKDEDGRTPLRCAVDTQSAEAIQALTAADPHNTPAVVIITSAKRLSNNLTQINFFTNKSNVISFKLEYRTPNDWFTFISYNVAGASRVFYLHGLPNSTYIRIKVKTNKGWSDYHEMGI